MGKQGHALPTVHYHISVAAAWVFSMTGHKHNAWHRDSPGLTPRHALMRFGLCARRGTAFSSLLIHQQGPFCSRPCPVACAPRVFGGVPALHDIHGRTVLARCYSSCLRLGACSQRQYVYRYMQQQTARCIEMDALPHHGTITMQWG